MFVVGNDFCAHRCSPNFICPHRSVSAVMSANWLNARTYMVRIKNKFQLFFGVVFKVRMFSFLFCN